MKKWLPWLILGLFALWVAGSRKAPRERDGFNAREFGRLPVLLNGRMQPLDSVARNALLQMRNKQSVLIEEPDRKWWQPPKSLFATEWLLEVLMKPEEADVRKVFRIDHPELQSMLYLAETNKHFSYLDLSGRLGELEKQAKRIDKTEAAVRTPFERQVMKLYNAVNLYHRLKFSLQPATTHDFVAELENYRQAIEPGVLAVRAREAGKTYDEKAFNTLLEFLGQYDFMKNVAYPLLVPPLDPEKSRDAWMNVGSSLLETIHSREIHPAVENYAAMSKAYHDGLPADFNRAVEAYRQWLSGKFTRELGKGRSEYFFSAFQPFYKSLVVYVAGFLFVCAYWIKSTPWLRRTALGLVLLGLVVHTFGLVFRMVLEGRPPVTNLYSSAIFIGWAAVILGVVLEKFYQDGMGLVTSSGMGFITLIIAHNLALGGDTMEMLRAVLDTNFWLATHVTTVTLGYAATFVAGFLAIIYIVRGTMTRSLAEPVAKALARMVYGIVCFATLFSFVGTVLGGIWADQSWGRFWGWDPKENGALLIVMGNAIYLHARWGRLCSERALMAIAVFGNIVTSFSWFGVNMLGVGLHAYGFMDQAFKWLLAFDLSQAMIIALALMPERYWLSFPALASAPLPAGPMPGLAKRKPSSAAA